jgi:hypothetical protein
MNRYQCDGPVLDEPGVKVCRVTGDDEFDCEACQADCDQAIDRAVEAQWERETWG